MNSRATWLTPASSPGRRVASAKSVAKGLKRDHLWGRQCVAHPGAVLDHRCELEVRIVGELDARRIARGGQGLHARRRDAHAGERARFVLDLGDLPGMQRAKTIRAWRQIGCDGSSFAGLQQHLNGDVRCSHRAGETETAVAQRAHGGRRGKPELDVLLEVAFVVDVARGTVRTARQFREHGDAEFRAAAVGAEQPPLHGEKPRLHGGKAGLDRAPRGQAELVGQCLGPDLGDIGHHAVEHQVGEPRAKSVAIGAAVDLAGQCLGARSRTGRQVGRRQLERCGAHAFGKRDGLHGALADRLTGLLSQPCAEHTADHTQRLPFKCVGHVRTAGAVGLEIEHGAEAAERPFREDPRLAKVPARDPLVRLLFPFEREARHLAPSAANDRPVGLRCRFERVRRQAHRLVEPVGIGQHRPEPIRRQVKRPGPGSTHRLLARA